MNDQPRTGESSPESDPKPVVDRSGQAAPTGLPPEGNVNPSTASEPAPAKKLTADEQMALYEKHLKENDWGHQPC